MIQFKLDSTAYQCSNPEEFTEIISRDKDTKALLLKYEGDLVFEGDGYDYLKTQFDAGFCDSIDLEVLLDCNNTGTFTSYFDGTIFLSDVKFNISKCEASCPFTDDSFWAKIYNNKEIKVPLDLTETKLGQTLTPCTQSLIQFYDPATAVYDDFPITGNRLCFDVTDVFTYLVAWMTDNTVTFTSTYLGALAADEQIAVLSGLELRTGNNAESPKISFSEMFKELDKKLNLAIGIDESGGVPRIRIEEADFFYAATTSATLTNAIDVTQGIDRGLLYSVLVIGSKKWIRIMSNEEAGSLSPNISDGFIDIEYHINGACNTNAKLDLVSNYIIDTNIIEDVLENNDGASANMATYDRDVFMVQYTGGSPNQATQGTYQQTAATTPALYNEMFINDNTFFDLSSTIVPILDIERSAKSANIGPLSDNDIECDTENADPDGLYNNVTFLFTPETTTIYNIEITLEVTDKITATGDIIECYMRANGTSQRLTGSTPYANTIYTFPNNADETVVFTLQNVPLDAGTSYRFMCTNLGASANFRLDAGTGATVDRIDFTIDNTINDASKNSRFVFRYNIDQTTWDTIKTDLTKRVDFSIYDSVSFETWARKISRNLETGECKVELANRVS